MASVGASAAATRRARSIARLAVALAAAVTPDEVGAVIAREGRAVLGAAAGKVSLLDEKARALRTLGVHGYSREAAETYDVVGLDAPVPSAEAVRTGRAMWLGDGRRWAPAWREGLRIHEAQGFAAVVVLPLFSEGQPSGVLVFSFRAPRTFRADERATGEALAALCSQALDRARLFASERAERAAAEVGRRRAAALARVGAAIAGAATPEQVGAAIAEEAREALGADAAIVLALGESGTDLRAVAALGYAPDYLSVMMDMPIDTPAAAAAAARTGRPIWLRTLDEFPPEWAPGRELQEVAGFHAACFVPLVVESRVVGVLAMSFRDPHDYSDDERAVAAALAATCGQAMERARLYEGDRRARRAAELARGAAERAWSASEHARERADTLAAITAALSAAPTPEEVERVLLVRAVPLLGASSGILALAERDPLATPEETPRLDDDGVPRADARGVPRRGEEPRHAAGDSAAGDPGRRRLMADTGPIEEAVGPESARRAARYRIALSVGVPGDAGDRSRTFSSDAVDPLAEAIASGTLVAVETSAELATRYPGLSLAAEGGPIRSLVALPLAVRGSAIGAVQLGFAQERTFGPDDRAYLRTIGDVSAQAIERSRLYVAERAARATLDAVVRQMPVGIVVVDAGSGEVVLQNAQMEAVFGSAAWRDEQPAASLVRRALALGEMVTDQEIEVRAGESTRTLAASAAPVLGPDGHIVGAVGVFSDISERRQAEAVRDTFLGILSHELRTPVTSIFGGTSLLLTRAGRLDEETRRTLLEDVGAEADRLNRLVEDLLVLARVERGAAMEGRDPILLQRLVPRLVVAEAPRWPQMRFEVDAAPQLPATRGDEGYVEQIVRNLVSNAAKYSPEGGIVRVEIGQDGPEVVVRVLDRGPGIVPGEADELFGLYYRSPRTAAKASGAGIGLFVVRTLVEAMHGRVWGRLRDGGGSEFGFALPVYAADDVV